MLGSIDSPSTPPDVVLARRMTEFAVSVDLGPATRSLSLFSDDLVFGDPADEAGIELLRSMMQMRERASYETRHAISFPLVEQADDTTIRGRAVMTVFRKAGDTCTVAAVDLLMGLALRDGKWSINALSLVPFGEAS
jgi:hypothetical protein